MKKIISFLCAALLIATGFTGCSKSGSAGSKAKTTITIMQSKVEIQTDLQKVVKDYNSSQNNVTVKLLGTSGDNYNTVLQSQFSATPAKAPTIFTGTGPSFEPFEKFCASLASSKAAAKLISSFKGDVVENGVINGLPMAVEGYGLIYNKTLFQKAGVDASSLTSIDALVNACKKLQKVSGVKSALAFSKETYFIFIHLFNWAFAVSPDYKSQIEQLKTGKLTMAQIPTVVQWITDIGKLKSYTNKGLDSYDDAVSGFVSGKYAMIHQGDWVQTLFDQDKISFDYGLIPFPTSNNTSLAVDTANAWRVNKYATAAQQKAAIDFLDWLILSDKGQAYCANDFGFIPVYQGVKSPTNKLAKEVSSYVTSGKVVSWVYNDYFPSGIDVDGAALMQKYYAGVINNNQFLNQLTKAWVTDANK